jgi:3-hydroxyisobutyrate dehydrogenase
MNDQPTVAVLGAGGTMGLAIAGNLARAGFTVRAWNRSREKAEPLARHGAEIFDTPREAAEGAGVILTILSDAQAVLAAMEGDDGALAAGAEGEAIWIQASTIGERGTDRCVELAREHDLQFVDAPVLGTKQPAERGQLVILASGPDRTRDRLRPILETIGQRTMWVGDAGAGTRLKLATNSWLLAVVEGGAEALAFAEGMGLDPRLVLEAIAGGPLDLPYLQTKAEAILKRDFAPSFRLGLAAKDAALVEEAVDDHDLDLPLLRTIRERLAEGATEHGDEDLAATYLTSAPG